MLNFLVETFFSILKDLLIKINECLNEIKENPKKYSVLLPIKDENKEESEKTETLDILSNNDEKTEKQFEEKSDDLETTLLKLDEHHYKKPTAASRSRAAAVEAEIRFTKSPNVLNKLSTAHIKHNKEPVQTPPSRLRKELARKRELRESHFRREVLKLSSHRRNNNQIRGVYSAPSLSQKQITTDENPDAANSSKTVQSPLSSCPRVSRIEPPESVAMGLSSNRILTKIGKPLIPSSIDNTWNSEFCINDPFDIGDEISEYDETSSAISSISANREMPLSPSSAAVEEEDVKNEKIQDLLHNNNNNQKFIESLKTELPLGEEVKTLTENQTLNYEKPRDCFHEFTPVVSASPPLMDSSKLLDITNNNINSEMHPDNNKD